MLMTCAAEDIQGGGLDSVPQLGRAVLHGDIRVNDWKVGQSVGQFVAEMEMVSRHIQQNSFNLPCGRLPWGPLRGSRQSIILEMTRR
ncbi:unnamed protein product [Schistocephalus solidus]|uniref:Secreted protein n=1 Tax=Schistocephalus solidus TaxID=70667 RepID=A0A183TSG0_SCHSO|nr:unnamed protein product [Schistocephalus solidus]